MRSYRYLQKLSLIIISIIFSACSHLSISKGQFDVVIPPSIEGAGKKLDDNAIALVAVNVNENNKNSVKLNNMKSNGYSEERVPSFIVDGQYGLENGYGSLSINVYNKGDGYDNPMALAYGAGVYPYPYAYISAGPNFEHFECGATVLIGVSNENAEFEGEGARYYGGYYENGSVTNRGEDIWHGNIGYGMYSSTFFKGLGFHYSGLVFYPWSFMNSLPGTMKYNRDDESGSTDEYEIDVSFPFIINQKVTISYIIKSVLQIRMGLGVVAGDQFAGRYWSKNVGLGYFF